MSRIETMTPRVAFAHKAEQAPKLGQRWRLAVTVSGLVLALAGCTGTPMAVTEMSAALSAELAAASAEAAEPVALSGGFASALAQAVETNAGYRAAMAQEREAASRVGVASSATLALKSDEWFFRFVIWDHFFHKLIHLNYWSEILRPPLMAWVSLWHTSISSKQTATCLMRFWGMLGA